MRQGELFDADKSQALKEQGMEAAEESNKTKLNLARSVAISLAKKFGEITADDVGEVMANVYGVASLGAAAGSLFKGGDWEFTGERRTSKRKSNHARELKVWRLREN